MPGAEIGILAVNQTSWGRAEHSRGRDGHPWGRTGHPGVELSVPWTEHGIHSCVQKVTHLHIWMGWRSWSKEVTTKWRLTEALKSPHGTFPGEGGPRQVLLAAPQPQRKQHPAEAQLGILGPESAIQGQS